jgi:hypothetical protein
VRLRNAVVAALLLVGTGVAAHAQSITNGTFNSSLAGWTVQDGDTQWRSDPGPDSLPGVAWLNDGPNVIAFIQQAVTGLTPGTTYQISGFYKSLVIFAGTGSFTATIDGVTDFANTDTSFVTNWTPFSLDFTPSAALVTLSLNSQVGSDSDYEVDNIAISSANTNAPEPGSLALIAGTGLLGLARFARRRKTHGIA